MYLENLVVDAADPQRLGRFWEVALDGARLTDAPGIFEMRVAVESGPAIDLCFQHVAEPATDPPRLHLDLAGGAEQDRVVERLIELGARHLDIGQDGGEQGVAWVVLADPEDNPLCVMEERASYVDTGPIAALPLASADPDRDAAFWSWLTGWTETPGLAPRSLRHPSRRGPLLEMLPEQAPKGPTKNRWHLDVRLEAGDDPDGVSSAVAARGGRELHPTWAEEVPWRLYCDPSGNDFCVLPVRS